MTRRNLDSDHDEQDRFDRTPICPRCEAVCDAGLDYCLQCGRKVKADRIRGGEGSGDVELDAYLRRSMGSRLSKFREDAGLNDDETDSLMEGQES